MMKGSTMRVYLISLILAVISQVASQEAPNSAQAGNLNDFTTTKHGERTIRNSKDNDTTNQRNGNWFPEVTTQDSHLLELIYAKLESFETRLVNLEEKLNTDLAKHLTDAEQRLIAKLIGVKFSARDGLDKVKVAVTANEQRLKSLVESTKESLKNGKSSTDHQLRNIQTQLSSLEQRQTGHLTSLVTQIEDKIKIHAKFCPSENESDKRAHNIDARFANVLDNLTASIYATVDKMIDTHSSNITATAIEETNLQLSELDEKLKWEMASLKQTLDNRTDSIQQNLDYMLAANDDRLDNLTSTFQSKIDNKLVDFEAHIDTKTLLTRPLGCHRGLTWLPYNESFPHSVVYPNVGSKITVPYLCDVTNDGGEWVVFHHRSSGNEDFYRGWDDYKRGFGSLTGDFWLGLDALYNLTSSAKYELRVDLEYNGKSAYATYQSFSVGPESENYRLQIEGYSGTAGDSLAKRHNLMEFTTMDRDNDNFHINCAVDRSGAWWYDDCFDSNLNGLWNTTGNWKAVAWNSFTGSSNSASYVEMKIRCAL